MITIAGFTTEIAVALSITFEPAITFVTVVALVIIDTAFEKEPGSTGGSNAAGSAGKPPGPVGNNPWNVDGWPFAGVSDARCRLDSSKWSFLKMYPPVI